jgi:hypothetical protein
MRTIVLVAATLAALPLTSIDALRRWTVVCPRHQRRHQLRISHLRAVRRDQRASMFTSRACVHPLWLAHSLSNIRSARARYLSHRFAQ